MAHFDFNDAGAHSYEQAIAVMRRLRLPMRDIEEQFRRAAFNIVARNQDDHVKNIAFLMDKRGQWSLSPAFDGPLNLIHSQARSLGSGSRRTRHGSETAFGGADRQQAA
jgi:hypothetical protein